MRSTPFLARSWLLCVMLFATTLLHANEAVKIEELDYGVALYDLYQARYYSSAVYLDASLHQQKIRHHKDEAELLLGSMMLYYGMHKEAETVFLRHTKEQQSAVSDRAWFYMAKLRYQRGLYDASLQALLNIKSELPDELQRERYHLHVMLLMFKEKYFLAADVISNTHDDDDLFAQYNLAVALERSQNSEQSNTTLKRLIRMSPKNNAEKMLQDKARIILAQRLLEQGHPLQAIKQLHLVSPNGIFADQALTALSWAYYEQGDNSQALASLKLLIERNSNDIQAKEAGLLQGYIFEQANATRDAKQSYDSAITRYQQDITKVDDAIASLNDGRFLNELLPQLRDASQGWGWEGQLELPKSSAPYVAVMLASYRFYEALQNLRDLNYLADQLHRWHNDMPSLQHMLELREKRYQELLPLLEIVKEGGPYQLLQNQHQTITQQLEKIAQQGEIYQLLDDDRRKQQARLITIEQLIEKLPESDKRAAYQQRYQRLKGLLEWDVSASFKARYWQRKKELRAQQQVFSQIDVKRMVLSEAKLTTPQMFTAYRQQLSNMSGQVSDLIARITTLYTRQEEELLRLAAEALQQYRSKLELYRDQAYYRVAYIKDNALEISDEVAP